MENALTKKKNVKGSFCAVSLCEDVDFSVVVESAKTPMEYQVAYFILRTSSSSSHAATSSEEASARCRAAREGFPAKK